MSSPALAIVPSASRRDSTAAAQEVAQILTGLGANHPIPPPKTEHLHPTDEAGQPKVDPPFDGDGSPPLRCSATSEEGGRDGNTTSGEGSFNVRALSLRQQHASGSLQRSRADPGHLELDREDGVEGAGRHQPLEPRADGGEDGTAPVDSKPPPASNPVTRLPGRGQEEDDDDGPAPTLSFPEVLFEVVSAPENAKAISWLPHGKGAYSRSKSDLIRCLECLCERRGKEYPSDESDTCFIQG